MFLVIQGIAPSLGGSIILVLFLFEVDMIKRCCVDKGWVCTNTS